MNGEDRKLLGRLEARQEDIMKMLDDLNGGIESILKAQHKSEIKLSNLDVGFNNHLRSHSRNTKALIGLLGGAITGIVALVTQLIG